MSQRVIRLKGQEMRGTRVRAQLLRDLLDVLIDGSKQAVRLQVEGRSTARGSAPAWLEQASGFDVVAIEEGSTCLRVDSPALQDAVSSKFRQIPLFGGVDASRSALDLMTDSLRDAAHGNEDSDLFDAALISTFSRIERLMKRGVETISFEDGNILELGRTHVQTISQMKTSIPASQRVRLSGKLNLIKDSDKRFELLQDKGTIHGVFEDATAAQLGSHFGRRVVVSGVAHFRPSGTVLRVEANRIQPAGADADLWGAPPTPLLSSSTQTGFIQHQGPRSGVSAIFGQWPGDESEEEIATLLAE